MRHAILSVTMRTASKSYYFNFLLGKQLAVTIILLSFSLVEEKGRNLSSVDSACSESQATKAFPNAAFLLVASRDM